MNPFVTSRSPFLGYNNNNKKLVRVSTMQKIGEMRGRGASSWWWWWLGGGFTYSFTHFLELYNEKSGVVKTPKKWEVRLWNT